MGPDAWRRVGLGFGWALMVLAYLFGLKQAPWTTFWPQWLWVVGWGVLLGTAATSHKGVIPKAVVVGGWGLLVAALPLVPLVQACLGLFAMPEEAPFLAIWLLPLLLTVIGLAQAAAVPSQRGLLLKALWTMLLAAALLTAVACLIQLQGWQGLGMVLEPLGAGGRASGNIGHPNLAATLLLWGVAAQLALLAPSQAKAVSLGARWGACLVLAVLGLALVSTQSRTGLLGLWMLVALSVLAPKHLNVRRYVTPLLLLAVLVSVAALAWPWLTEQAWGVQSAALSERASAGKRPDIWRLGWAAVQASPWWGYGWNQGLPAHVKVAQLFTGVQVPIAGFHHLPLDLAIWLGMPATLLLLGAALHSLAWRWRRLAEEKDFWLLAGALMFGLHAALEVPHFELHYLLPALVMLALIQTAPDPGSQVGHRRWTIRSAWLPVLWVLGAVVAICVARDYSTLQTEVYVQRVLAARIQLPDTHRGAAPDSMWIPHLADVLRANRARLEERPSNLDAALSMARRYPSVVHIEALVQQLDALGHADAAAAWRQTACAMHTAAVCAALR
jgi:O-antigen ligase